jgi:hypothetical protein
MHGCAWRPREACGCDDLSRNRLDTDGPSVPERPRAGGCVGAAVAVLCTAWGSSAALPRRGRAAQRAGEGAGSPGRAKGSASSPATAGRAVCAAARWPPSPTRAERLGGREEQRGSRTHACVHGRACGRAGRAATRTSQASGRLGGVSSTKREPGGGGRSRCSLCPGAGARNRVSSASLNLQERGQTNSGTRGRARTVPTCASLAGGTARNGTPPFRVACSPCPRAPRAPTRAPAAAGPGLRPRRPARRPGAHHCSKGTERSEGRSTARCSARWLRRTDEPSGGASRAVPCGP